MNEMGLILISVGKVVHFHCQCVSVCIWLVWHESEVEQLTDAVRVPISFKPKTTRKDERVKEQCYMKKEKKRKEKNLGKGDQ